MKLGTAAQLVEFDATQLERLEREEDEDAMARRTPCMPRPLLCVESNTQLAHFACRALNNRETLYRMQYTTRTLCMQSTKL